VTLVAVAPTNSTTTPLAGRWAALRGLGIDDEPAINEILAAPGNLHRYRYRGATPGPAQLHHDLWAGVLAQFVICRRNDPTPVGLVSAFNANLFDGHAHLGVCLDPTVHRRGWPLEAVGLFVEHLFQCFELRKLYAQLGESTSSCFRSAIGDLLVEEARLRDHHYYAGRYEDSVIYALWRSRWFDPDLHHRRLLLARPGDGHPAVAAP
jgi:hypothetical protein